MWVTTKKPKKTNGITNRIFSSVIITDEIFPFRLKICRYIPTAQIRRLNDRYIPTEIFRRYIPTVSPTGYTVCLEIYNGVVTSDYFTDGMTEGFKLVSQNFHLRPLLNCYHQLHRTLEFRYHLLQQHFFFPLVELRTTFNFSELRRRWWKKWWSTLAVGGRSKSFFSFKLSIQISPSLGHGIHPYL